MDENTELKLFQTPMDTNLSRGATIMWRNVNVYARDKKRANNENRLKQIINNATGFSHPGTLMAVMGSSGAGKSTLMSALAYRNMAGIIVKGEILVNNRPIGPFMHRQSGFVHQDDLFDGTLTVLEHLTFVANLKLDKRMSKQEKTQLVSTTLCRVGLTRIKDTRIGDTNKGKTLSGGEKKRLSFAAELLTNPVLLFCDEPTTGLDAYGAQQLIRILLRLTRQGTTIMCTIHQPSSQLFAMFHQVLLLAEGRVAFIGSPHEAVTFFSLNGYHCPSTYNPADFLIGVLAKSETGKDGKSVAYKLSDVFDISRKNQLNQIESNFTVLDDSLIEIQKPLWIFTVFWLIHRNLLIVARDPTVQKIRILQKIAIAIMAGLCFYGTVTLSQYGIQSVQGALFILITENTFAPMYSALTLFPQRYPLFMRERQAGLYNTFQYYFTSIVALIPGLIVEPVLFTIICYWLAGLRATAYAFVMTAIITIFVMNIATACGCFFSIAFNSVDVAIAYLVPFDVSLMVTSGVFIRLNTIPYALSWLKYLSWLMYANEAMSIVQWQGVQNITCIDNGTELPCLGSADEIFEQYNFDEQNLGVDFLAMTSLFVVFHVLAYLILWFRVRKM